jgi:hypothetical protein
MEMIFINADGKIYFMFNKNKITYSPNSLVRIQILYKNCWILNCIKNKSNKDIHLSKYI